MHFSCSKLQSWQTCLMPDISIWTPTPTQTHQISQFLLQHSHFCSIPHCNTINKTAIWIKKNITFSDASIKRKKLAVIQQNLQNNGGILSFCKHKVGHQHFSWHGLHKRFLIITENAEASPLGQLTWSSFHACTLNTMSCDTWCLHFILTTWLPKLYFSYQLRCADHCHVK